jgi:multiple sugar transport system substrate-binding protein
MNFAACKVWLVVAAVAGTIVWSEKLTQDNPPPGPVHVVYWEKWSDFEADAMRDVVNDFNKSQNRIFVDFLPVSGVETKTLMAIAGGSPPDVAGLYGNNVAQYAEDEAIENLDQRCKDNGILRDQYIPVFIDICTVHNHIYALPSAPASVALHYNKKMFRDAGLDPNKPPKTIEEMDKMSEKIFKKTGDKIVAAGFLAAEPGWWNFAWGYWFGGRLWDGVSKITANSPENVKAFTWIQNMSKKFGVQSLQTFRGGFGTFNSPQNAFMQEQVAMELQGVWMANFIGKYNPKMEWGVVPFPYPQDRPDLAGHTIADLDVLAIPRGAKHPNEAFEFIKYVESVKGMERLCLEQKKNSPLKHMPPDFYAHHPNPNIRLFNDLPKHPGTFSVPRMGIWPEYQAALNDAFDAVNLQTTTPQEALDEVQAIMQPKLDESLEHLRMRGVIQ